MAKESNPPPLDYNAPSVPPPADLDARLNRWETAILVGLIVIVAFSVAFFACIRVFVSEFEIRGGP